MFSRVVPKPAVLVCPAVVVFAFDSSHTISKQSGPDVRVTSSRPSATERAPYFTALVAYSWNSSARLVTHSALMCGSSPCRCHRPASLSSNGESRFERRLKKVVDFRPDLIAVALGCFEAPSAIRPTQSVYETTQYTWVSLCLQDPGEA